MENREFRCKKYKERALSCVAEVIECLIKDNAQMYEDLYHFSSKT